ncbi:MAG: DNA gyrase C-terminal beta-propeller domain-containing protein, partial [Halanaerobiales bacterium]
IRTEVNQISCISRNTQGVKVMTLEEGDRVVALAGIAPEDEDEGENIELEDIDIEDIDLQDSGLDDIELKDIELKDIEPEDNDLEDFTDID